MCHTGMVLIYSKKIKVLKLNYVSGTEEHSLLLRLKNPPDFPLIYVLNLNSLVP